MPRSVPEASQAETLDARKLRAAAVRAEVERLTAPRRRLRARVHEARAQLARDAAERARGAQATATHPPEPVFHPLDLPGGGVLLLRPRSILARAELQRSQGIARGAVAAVVTSVPVELPRGGVWLRDRRAEWSGEVAPVDRVELRRARVGLRCLACGTLRTGIEVRDLCSCGAVWPGAVERGTAPVEIPVVERDRNRAAWHAGRAEGQRARFSDAENCGVGELRARCVCGGGDLSLPLRCGVVRLCTVCLERRATETRTRFGRAWVIYRHRLEAAGVLAPGWRAARCGECGTKRAAGEKVCRCGVAFRLDPWRERHVTLTAPHDRPRWFVRADGSRVAGDRATVEWRVDRVMRAWSTFVRRLRAWCDKQIPVGVDGAAESLADGGVRPVWFRAFEWTSGGDDLGHPHFHIWIVSPMLRVELVRSWWAASLASAFDGTPNELGSLPVRADGSSCVNVDVRDASVRCSWIGYEVEKGWKRGEQGAQVIRLQWEPAEREASGLVEYFGGWSIDLSGDVAPEVQAGVFEALEGRRMSQGASGFLGLAVRPLCKCEACSLPRVLASRTVETWAAKRDAPPAAGPVLEVVADDAAPRSAVGRSRSAWVPAAFAAARAQLSESGPTLAEWLADLRGEARAAPDVADRSVVRARISAAAELHGRIQKARA